MSRALVTLPAALVALLALTLVAVSQPAPSESAEHTVVEIDITVAGLVPEAPIVPPGASIQWTNNSGSVRSIFTDDGRLNSGQIAPGAGSRP